MPGLPLSISRFHRISALLLFVLLCTAPAGAWRPNVSKYPLRFHVLASDETYQTPRMSPAESVVCDEIDGMLSSISPNPGGPITVSGVSGDPCSLHADMIQGRLLDIQQEESFSGKGRGDLVSPPITTQGLTFHYDDCSRVRVHPGFQSLPARWKKPGQKLEVLVPSDDIPVNGRPLPPVKCSFSVTVHDYVYLLLRNGSLIEVSQDLYREKPALRVFLSGTELTVQQREQQFTVSAHPAKQ